MARAGGPESNLFSGKLAKSQPRKTAKTSVVITRQAPSGGSSSMLDTATRIGAAGLAVGAGMAMSRNPAVSLVQQAAQAPGDKDGHAHGHGHGN
jgi:hypothetical protein